jgi:hypothetical protein
MLEIREKLRGYRKFKLGMLWSPADEALLQTPEIKALGRPQA